MTVLSQRRCVVIVDGVRIEGLRCTFRAVKTLEKAPNALSLKITNLAESTRAKMQKRGAAVVLSAGYVNDSAVIFSGDARTIDHTREGADWVTHVQCGDGERAYAFARFSQSYKAGTSKARVALDAANALGVNPGNLAAQLEGRIDVFDHGYSAHGRASDELDRVLQSMGLTWSIQDGAILVLRSSSDTVPGFVPSLTPDSGLIGSPDHGTPSHKGGPSVLKVRALLRPQIRLGGVVAISSASVKGQFRVHRLEHRGDTAGGEWYTEMECTPR